MPLSNKQEKKSAIERSDIMPVSDITLTTRPPDAKAFAALRETAGWNNPAMAVIQKSIGNSLFWVCLYSEETLIGCGRLIGDGAMYFYLQDVIVHPAFQELGLGARIMESINGYIAEHCPAGSTAGLLAAKGKEGFYAKYGFTERDGEPLGHGMCRFITD